MYKHLLFITVVTLFATTLFAGVDKKLAKKASHYLVQQNRRILILADKSVPKKFFDIFNKKVAPKTQRIIVQKYDGIYAKDSMGLLLMIKNRPKSYLLRLLLNDVLVFDKIYCLRNSGSLLIGNDRNELREHEKPESKCYQHASFLYGYIVLPFTVTGVDNEAFQFSAEKTDKIINLILEHVSDQCFSYEDIVKVNHKSQLREIAKRYFENERYSNNIWSKDLIETFELTDQYLNFGPNVNDYLINIFNKGSGTDKIRSLRLLRNTFEKSIRNVERFSKVIHWLDEIIADDDKQSSEILKRYKNFHFSLTTNFKDKYKAELQKKFEGFKQAIISIFAAYKETYLIPINLSVFQQSDEEITIRATFEIDVDEYLKDQHIYDEKRNIIAFDPWVFDLLEHRISYPNYLNEYELVLKKKNSSEKLTIFGYMDLKNWKDIFAQILQADLSGNAYQAHLLRESLKIQYSSNILYDATFLPIPIFIDNSFKVYDSGFTNIFLGNETKTMAGQLTENSYLYRFFNIGF